MKFQVTQEDIDEGDPGSCQECPVALSVVRGLGPRGVSGVRVTGCDIVMYQHGSRAYWAPTPPAVSQFVQAFDDGTNRLFVKPFEFELPDDRLPPVEAQ